MTTVGPCQVCAAGRQCDVWDTIMVAFNNGEDVGESLADAFEHYLGVRPIETKPHET